MATYNNKPISIREWTPHYQQLAGIAEEVQQRLDDEMKAKGILPPSPGCAYFSSNEDLPVGSVIDVDGRKYKVTNGLNGRYTALPQF